MIYPEDFESKIGFNTIRNIIIEGATSRLGKDYAREMKFSNNFDLIKHDLLAVKEMRTISTSSLPFPNIASHDITPYLNELKPQHSFISAEKIFKLLQMLVSFEDIIKFFESQKEDNSKDYQFPELRKDIANLISFPGLIKSISNTINKFGEIKDTASPELYEIRQAIKRAAGAMQRAMRSVVDAAQAAGILDKDVNPSIRDGRMVIPVQAGNKRSIPGIVHDQSATGKTVFIEPVQVVEAGNKMRELEIEQKREETKILISLAEDIRPYITDIEECCKILGFLDFVMAKAKLAETLGAEMPHIENNTEIEWYNASHPGLMISLQRHGKKVVPLNLMLNQDKRILIISGPNAGGKSVCLKTVAIIQYMMQCGVLPTLNDNSHMGIFNNLFIDIGDEQSFENDLSTYSSHLKNMKFFMANANKKSLILADEMGSGTEPQIGGAMAQAILENLGSSGCYGVVTTHYQNLKTFAEDTPGFVNGAMLYDRAHLEPMFQLAIGTPGSSFALDIAHKMGLPIKVIDEAKRLVGEDYVNIDKYIADITRDRKYWSNKRQSIREKENKLDALLSKYEEVAGDLKSQRKAIINDAKKEAKDILAEANAKIERTILEIRKSQAEKEKTKQLRKELKDFADSRQDSDLDSKHENSKIKTLKHKSKNSQKKIEIKPQIKKEIQVGDYVKLEDGSTVGQVMSISGKKAVVAFGALKTIVETKKLKSSSKPKESALKQTSSYSSSTSEESRKRQLNFKNEIDVRGMRADEAIQAVIYFIDDAIQFNAGKVRILHGTGHGILKTMIRQQLKSNTAIKSFEDEDIRFGGAGITVVTLE